LLREQLYWKLTCFEYYTEIAWLSSFDVHDLNQEQPMSSGSSVVFCCFSNGIFSKCVCMHAHVAF